jgi:signal transduction histidine kinase
LTESTAAAHPLPATARARRNTTAAAAAGAWLVLLGVGAGFMLLGAAGVDKLPQANLRSSADWLVSASSVLAAVVGATCLMRWRLVQDQAALWIGAALEVYAVGSLAFPELMRSISTGVSPGLAASIRAASVFTVMVMLVCSLGSGRRTGATPARVASAAIVFALLLTAVFAMIPKVATALSAPHFGDDITRQDKAGQIAVALCWLALGALHVRRGLRDDRQLHVWIGLMLVGFTEARLALVFAVSLTDPVMWQLDSQIVRGLALAFALWGTRRELELAFVQQRRELADSLRAMRHAERQHRAVVDARAEEHHDLRSALLAIDSATHVLTRTGPGDEQGPSTLTHALRMEIARLHEMLSGDRARTEAIPFNVDQVILPVVVVHRATGARVDVDLPSDTAALGDPNKTAEVLRNLLDNASRYAPQSRIVITAELADDRVRMLVSDYGAGIAIRERKQIFERGGRGSTADPGSGSGLGLYVSRRLMEEQGGSLTLADGRKPTTFVMELPRAAVGVPETSDQRVDDPDELSDIEKLDRALLTSIHHERPRGAVGAGEHHP